MEFLAHKKNRNSEDIWQWGVVVVVVVERWLCGWACRVLAQDLGLVTMLGGSQPSGSQAPGALTLSLAFPGYLHSQAQIHTQTHTYPHNQKWINFSIHIKILVTITENQMTSHIKSIFLHNFNIGFTRINPIYSPGCLDNTPGLGSAVSVLILLLNQHLCKLQIKESHETNMLSSWKALVKGKS